MESARSAVPADLADVEALAVDARERLADQRGGAQWLSREAPALGYLAEAVDADDRLLLVGAIDDVVVGYALMVLEELGHGERLARIADLYVQPEARGVGVGECLITELDAAARGWGCTGLDSVALPGDRATKNFFETHGLVARAIIVHRRLTDDR